MQIYWFTSLCSSHFYLNELTNFQIHMDTMLEYNFWLFWPGPGWSIQNRVILLNICANLTYTIWKKIIDNNRFLSCIKYDGNWISFINSINLLIRSCTWRFCVFISLALYTLQQQYAAAGLGGLGAFAGLSGVGSAAATATSSSSSSESPSSPAASGNLGGTLGVAASQAASLGMNQASKSKNEKITIQMVANDSFGQTHNPASSDHYHLKIVLLDFENRRTTCVKIVITTGPDCGSAS